MEYLKIKNKGELDVRLISLMGGSTKQNDQIKIGKFGTGLKYSLAWLVRNNIDFRIFVGEDEVKIEVKKEIIQDTTFEIIYINGERSSITSTMGLDWEAWMICREIYCNALDEGNVVKEIASDYIGEENTTTFYIQNVGEIKNVVDNWEQYFIAEKPIYETSEFSIYPAQDRLCIYKQGVLIHKEKDIKSIFSYDIKNADINELREYKGYLTVDIIRIIQKLDKNCIDIFLSKINNDNFEGNMDYDYYGDFSKNWTDTIGQAKIISFEDLRSLKDRRVDIDESELIVLPKSLFGRLSGKFPNISAVRRADKVNSFFEVLDKDLDHTINKGLSILESVGYEINPELKYISGVFGNPNIFAKISIDTKTIMFSTELKRKSIFDVVTTIVEENEHYISGYGDCSRDFQQHFIDLYVKSLLSSKGVLI